MFSTVHPDLSIFRFRLVLVHALYSPPAVSLPDRTHTHILFTKFGFSLKSFGFHKSVPSIFGFIDFLYTSLSFNC